MKYTNKPFLSIMLLSLALPATGVKAVSLSSLTNLIFNSESKVPSISKVYSSDDIVSIDESFFEDEIEVPKTIDSQLILTQDDSIRIEELDNDDESNNEDRFGFLPDQGSNRLSHLWNKGVNWVKQNPRIAASAGTGLAVLGGYLAYKKSQAPVATLESLKKEYLRLDSNLEKELTSLEYAHAVQLLVAYAKNSLTGDKKIAHDSLMQYETYKQMVNILDQQASLNVAKQ